MERISLVNVGALLGEMNQQQQAAELANSQTLFTSPTTQSGAASIVDIARQCAEGQTVHYMTNGAWSHYQLIVALQSITGPADLYTSSYAMSEASVRCLCNMQEQGLLKQIYAVIDNRIETRTAGSHQLLKSICTKLALVASHAKVAVLAGATRSVLVLGSANFSENKRIETGIVTADAAACTFHTQWITDVIQQHGRNPKK